MSEPSENEHHPVDPSSGPGWPEVHPPSVDDEIDPDDEKEPDEPDALVGFLESLLH